MENFQKFGVVSDVIDSVPANILTLKYGDISVDPGMTLTPTQAQNVPTVSFPAEATSFYTLIMNDPDAPSRKDPKFGEWHHWLVMNVPGDAVSQGEVMSEYVGAGPPKGTGLHRYVFLVYKQKEKIDTSSLTKLTNTSPDGRPKHSVKQFQTKHSLAELVAGNFFEAEYDDYVPLLYKQLGF